MFLTIISGTNAAWYKKDLVQPDLADVRITTCNTQTQLPFAVEAGKVEARFARGVLYVTLPRAEADKPRKISIKSE